MKMIFIAYNMAIDEEVMESLEEVGTGTYTKWTRVHGKGKTSGPHLDSNVWPGVNNVLAIVVEDEKVSEILLKVQELRKSLGKEGIKAFVLPLEEVT